MSDDATPRLALPYLAESQGQPEVKVNEGRIRLDMAVQAVIDDRDLSAPPGAPTLDATYLIAAAPTGAWAGHAGDPARWDGSAWRYMTPGEGFIAYVLDEEVLILRGASAWVGIGSVTGIDAAIAARVAKAGDTMSGPLVIEVTGTATATIRGQGNTFIDLYRFSGDATAAAVICAKARGTIASPAAVVQNDQLARWLANGHDGTNFRTGAEIRAVVKAATPGAADMETQVAFFACAPGSGSLTEVMHYDHAQGLTTLKGRVVALRRVTAAGAVTMANTDHVVVVAKTTGAATTVNLPPSPVVGKDFEVWDGKGDAATNNITLTPAAGTINGAATWVIATNWGRAVIKYDGTQWLAA